MKRLPAYHDALQSYIQRVNAIVAKNKEQDERLTNLKNEIENTSNADIEAALTSASDLLTVAEPLVQTGFDNANSYVFGLSVPHDDVVKNILTDASSASQTAPTTSQRATDQQGLANKGVQDIQAQIQKLNNLIARIQEVQTNGHKISDLNPETKLDGNYHKKWLYAVYKMFDIMHFLTTKQQQPNFQAPPIEFEITYVQYEDNAASRLFYFPEKDDNPVKIHIDQARNFNVVPIPSNTQG